MDDIQELMIIKQFVIQLTPFRYGNSQNGVDVVRTIDGFEISWGNDPISVEYINYLNDGVRPHTRIINGKEIKHRGSTKHKGFADRTQSFCQSYLDDILTEMQLRETMNDNIDNTRIETNTTYNAYMSKITLIKGE